MGKDASGKWAASDTLLANNGIYTFTIPKNLKAGQYIIRNEMYACDPGIQDLAELIHTPQPCPPYCLHVSWCSNIPQLYSSTGHRFRNRLTYIICVFPRCLYTYYPWNYIRYLHK